MDILSFVPGMIAAILIFAGICLIGSQLMNCENSLKSPGWPQAQAQVITLKEAIKLGAKYDPVGDALTKTYFPQYLAPRTLPYKFDLQYGTFAATTYSFSIDPLGPTQKQIEAENPVGAVITVHYNKLDPGIAAVSAGFNPHLYINILIGVVLLAVGAKMASKLTPKV